MKDLTIDRFKRTLDYKHRAIDKAILKKQYQTALLLMNDVRKLNMELYLAGCFSYSEMKEYNKEAGASEKKLTNTERRMYNAVISRRAIEGNNEA